MTTTRFKSTLIALSVVIVILAVLYGKCLWNHTLLSVRLSFADEQIKIFDDMRIKASHSELREAAGYLEYTLNYYPSGSKQTPGSPLDHIVENARANAVARIINDLRNRTGEDFGDDPQGWIDQK